MFNKTIKNLSVRAVPGKNDERTIVGQFDISAGKIKPDLKEIQKLVADVLVEMNQKMIEVLAEQVNNEQKYYEATRK